MKRLIQTGIAIGVLWYLFQPFYTKYINSAYPVGSDYTLHLSNLDYFDKHRVFPVKAWQGTWFGGYPVVEGYPWLQYHLMLPLVSSSGGTAQAMESYAILSLFLYFAAAFCLLFYVSKNWLAAMFLSMIVMYGTDSGLNLFDGGFVIFTASQLFLPLVLWLVLIAGKKKSFNWWLVTALAWALGFYCHPSITTLVIVPAAMPLIILNRAGKLTINSMINTVRVGIITALLAGLMVYQYVDQSLRGADLTSKRLAWAEAPERWQTIVERINPLLIGVLAVIGLLAIVGRKKLGKKMRPFWLSLSLLAVLFLLMFFRIGSLDTIFFAERMSWGISLMVVVILAKLLGELTSGKIIKISLSLLSLGLILTYGYILLKVKPEQLMPQVLKRDYAHAGTGTGFDLGTVIPKYYKGENYPLLKWQKEFDNYRTDGMDYIIYMWSNLLMPNTRYKGFFQPLKGLPLRWSGFVTETELGMLDKDSRLEMSQTELNRSLFWLDWYGIRRFQDSTAMAALDKNLGEQYVLAPYWRKPPLVEAVEVSGDLSYYSLDSELISPMYAPTNTATAAIIGGLDQYDNLIRILAYSPYNSQKLIPVYLGKSLGAVKNKDLAKFTAVILYGYHGGLTNEWQHLSEYVKNGGKLIIETGQKSSETAALVLPEVFPVAGTQAETITQSWPASGESSWLTQGAEMAKLQPLTYKYLPFDISKASSQGVRSWAKTGLTKNGAAVIAYGSLGKGKVVWSGLNLPFHAVDNRNEAETKIFNNMLDWLFQDWQAGKTGEYQVSHPTSEEIIVSGKEAKGVLIKENYSPGWQATVNNKRVKIYKAGLMQMYVILPQDSQEFRMELKYQGDLKYWLILGVSGLTLLAIFVSLRRYDKNI